MANADLTKISVFIFFDKTYLQKPHCIMIEYISSNKTQLQLRFVFKNKDLKRLFITSPSLHWFPQVVVWTLAITHTSCKDLKVESDFSTIFSLSENCHPDKHKHTYTHTHTHTHTHTLVLLYIKKYGEPSLKISNTKSNIFLPEDKHAISLEGNIVCRNIVWF